jgi:photosystem II stability/assembly factor-like uncharacterized protein
VAALLCVSSLQAQDTWQPLDAGTTQDLHAVHFVSADVGYVAGAAGTVLKTTDGGTTWADVSPGISRDFYGIYFFDANEGVVVGSQGAIGRTVDGGATWAPVQSGTSQTLYAVSFAGDVGIAGAASQTIIRSENRGASWERVQGGFFGGGFFGADMVTEAVGVVAGENSIFQPLFGYSANGGQSFDFTRFYLNSNEGQLEDVRFFDPQEGVAAGYTWDGQGAISRTTDGGQNWITVLFPDALYGVDFATDEVGYAVGSSGSLLKTADGGLSWAAVPGATTATLYDVSLPAPSTGYAVGSGGTVLKGVLAPSAPVALAVAPVDPPVLVSPGGSFQYTVQVTNVSGAAVTFDLWAEAVHGGSGLSVTQGPRTIMLPAGASREVTVTQRVPAQAPEGAYTYTVFAGTFPDAPFASEGFPVTVLPSEAAGSGSGAWTVTFDGPESRGVTQPERFALEPAAPNPFRAQTAIRFILPEGAHVSLRVYDALGKEVAVLADGYRDAGLHEVRFDASHLSAGVYLCRLDAGAFAATQRVMLVP